MFYHKIIRSMTLLALLGCSSAVFADTCPPAGQLPANWAVVMGNVSSVPFQGAVYGMFNPMAMVCKYYDSDPMSGYVLSSNFNVQKPNYRKDLNWQPIAGFISCISKNIESCQFTAHG